MSSVMARAEDHPVARRGWLGEAGRALSSPSANSEHSGGRTGSVLPGAWGPERTSQRRSWRALRSQVSFPVLCMKPGGEKELHPCRLARK